MKIKGRVTEKLPKVDAKVKTRVLVNRGELPLAKKPKKPVDNSGTD